MNRIAQLEIMLDENPEDPFLIYALAQEYEKINNTMQALLMYEHLIQAHPDYIATYYHYAKILYTGGNRNEGIRLLRQGIGQGETLNEAHAVSEMKGLLAAWTLELEDED